MNILKVYVDTLMFEGNEIEQGKYFVDDKGCLTVFGNVILNDFCFSPIYDKEFLNSVREQYIQKTWLLGRQYVQGWFQLKETEYRRFITSDFLIKEYSETREYYIKEHE